MRPVSSATCTSGEPVSVSCSRCSVIVAVLSGMLEWRAFLLCRPGTPTRRGGERATNHGDGAKATPRRPGPARTTIAGDPFRGSRPRRFRPGAGRPRHGSRPERVRLPRAPPPAPRGLRCGSGSARQPRCRPRGIPAQAKDATTSSAAPSPLTRASAVTGGRRSWTRRGCSTATRRPGSRVQGGVQDLVIGRARPRHDAARAPSAADEARGERQQRQSLLPGPVAGREQLVVEVEKHDHRCQSGAVQHGLGPDEDRGVRQAVRSPRDARSRPPRVR